MILLVTDMAVMRGGVQTVNQLFRDVARRQRIAGVIVARHDSPDAVWLKDWPGSYGAAGSAPRLLAGAWRRSHHARASVILATHIGLAPVGRWLRRVSGGRFYMFLHGVEAWGPLPRATRWGLRACDAFVTNSHFTLDKFRAAHAEFAAMPGTVCYLPAQLTPAANAAAKRKLRVLTVGRLWGRGLRKGQKQIIALWPRLRERFPDAEYWVIGGGDGRAELEDLARQHGVASSVTFTGDIPNADLSELYRTSAVYAMPSWGEGFGLVFADAMAHGLPCLASRSDAGREVVQDGVTGLHVDPEDSAEIFQALCKLLSDENLRTRLGQAGQARQAELFSLESFAANAANILRGEV